MNKSERKAALSLSTIFSFRMLGLFMILPVFSLYAEKLAHSTPLLIGMAIGIYGLTQALLQIPFGFISDRIGRKPVIAFGLVIFAIGSVVAALSGSIEGVLIGRAIQGAGAIGSTLTALLADLTSEENRTKAMAMIGMTIGLAFALAMVLGPSLAAIIDVSGIFWLTSALAVLGFVFLYIWVPSPEKSSVHRDAQPVPELFKSILTDIELLRLDFGIFAMHAILTASFVVMPIVLQRMAGLPESHQWYLYLPVLVLAFIAMLPMIIIAEKHRRMKSMFLFGISLLIFTQMGLWLFHQSAWAMGVLLFVFFTAFTFLEASLPSLISKRAPAGSKGTAMGVYSSSQFIGIFVGGAMGGWLYGLHDVPGVFFGCGILALIWFGIAFGMQKPRYLATRVVKLGNVDTEQVDGLTEELLKIAGVAEAMIMPHEGVAYLKVDSKVVNEDELLKFSN